VAQGGRQSEAEPAPVPSTAVACTNLAGPATADACDLLVVAADGLEPPHH
jgi:hypothetical protein